MLKAHTESLRQARQIIFLSAFALIFCLSSTANSTPPENNDCTPRQHTDPKPLSLTPEQDIKARKIADEVLNIIRQKLPREGEPNPDRMTPVFTEGTGASFFFYMLENINLFASIVDNSSSRDEEILKLADDFVAKYTEAHRCALNNQNNNDLAPTGTEFLDADNAFVNLHHLLKGRHRMGHSDITQLAVNELTDLPFNTEAKKILVSASQSPDFYRWEKIAFHAHTPDYKCIKPEENGFVEKRRDTLSNRITKGKNDFKDLLLCIYDKRIKGTLEFPGTNHQNEKALFWLGVGLHTVQDLVYHKGITLSQHSGLSYIGHGFEDPDFPKGSLDKKTFCPNDRTAIDDDNRFCQDSPAEGQFKKAIGYSKEFINAVRTGLENKNKLFAFDNMRSSGPLPLTFKAFAEITFGNTADMGAISLYQYWSLKNEFGYNPRESLPYLVPKGETFTPIEVGEFDRERIFSVEEGKLVKWDDWLDLNTVKRDIFSRIENNTPIEDIRCESLLNQAQEPYPSCPH